MEEVVRFRVGAGDKEKLVNEAGRLGMPVSALLRLLVGQWLDGKLLLIKEGDHDRAEEMPALRRTPVSGS